MKCSNQGVKEETLTQTSRRGGDRHPGRQVSWPGGGWRTGGPAFGRDNGEQDRPTTQGPSREIKPQTSD